MSRMSDLLRSNAQSKARSQFVRNPAAYSDGSRLWDQVFGGTSKEDLHKNPRVRPTPGGSYGQSITSSDPAIIRLLQAYRSMAPGGWTDDRYEQSRHFIGVNYIAIHRKAEQLAQSEFQVFRKDPESSEGMRPVTPDDPPEGDRQCKPYDLVHLLERPNDDDSFGDILYSMVQQLDLTGTSLTWMVPNQFKRPFQLYPVPTAVAIPQPAINPDFPDGYYRIQPLYPYGPFSSYPTPTTAVGAPIPAQWMLQIRYTHPLLRYEGWSPLTGLRLQSDSLDAIDSSRFYKMQRTFNPDAVVQFDEMTGAQPLPENEIERLRVQWMNAFQGPQNAGNILFSPPGSRIETFGSSPRDMDYQAGWEQLMSFMLAGFGITKPAAGMIEDASYASLYATLKQLYWLTLEPLANKIAAKLTRHIAPFFGDDLIIKIRCRRIDDHDIEFTKFDKGASGKCMTKNEGRKILGLAVTDEEWGDEILGYEEPPQQPGMPGMGSPDMEGQQGAEGEQGGAIDQLAEIMEGGEEVEAAPTPGKLSEGSLGPKLKAHVLRQTARRIQQHRLNGTSKNGRY